ncbi:putative 7-deoxyloganetin glucosyltransferase [Rosa chinensis]|uniref:Putative 7-deoxyloganetin glucosyltransferase n=1 Tax=Rosa chinensis TaxID=74649 RepID=A0A2P6S0W3_ROSCH|nr:putative 7-deoxyloganetin glucosyltransferase [Rosa chinensis]
MLYVPFPCQGHIKPFLKFAKLLHHRDRKSLDGLPDIQFEAIPDGLPPNSDSDSIQDITANVDSIDKNFLSPFCNILDKINPDAANSHSTSQVLMQHVVDGFTSFSITAAEELGIPIVMFFTIAACGFMGIKQFRSRLEKGYTPVKETECLQWLKSKAPTHSCLCEFCSVVVMTPQQFVEFGWRLANSKLPFLWIIRRDLIVGESAILPPTFVAETMERGVTASWCPQEEVLNHPSVWRIFNSQRVEFNH